MKFCGKMLLFDISIFLMISRYPVENGGDTRVHLCRIPCGEVQQLELKQLKRHEFLLVDVTFQLAELRCGECKRIYIYI